MNPLSESVRRRLEDHPGFEKSLLAEVGELFLNGDIETAMGMLATYIKATCGYEELAQRLDKPSSSIKRMLSEKGNPTATNLAALLSSLSSEAGVVYHVEVQAP
jgi:DNA-binding phage protein